MKEKLKELLIKADENAAGKMITDYKDAVDDIADYLLVNGVVVIDTDVVSPENRPLITHFAGIPVDEVLDLIRAKEEGRIIAPPCKVGDTVYDIYGAERICERKVSEINIRIDKRNKPWLIIDGYYFSFDDFRKNAFLSREEAEEVLKGVNYESSKAD